MTDLKDVVFETDHYWVKRVPKGFEVYKTGLTHSTRVAVIGYTGDKGLERAKAEIARREAAGSERQHATKRSPAQLQREIDEVLARKFEQSPHSVHSPAWEKERLVRKLTREKARLERSAPRRSHATTATGESSPARGPSKEKLQQAAKWIRRELTKRADESHPSHLASRVLEEADEKFQLGSFGVEGWAKSPSIGYQYLNYGDSYDPTIVVRSNPTRATVIVALGGWASYA